MARVPPHSEEAERGVLGSMMVDAARAINVALERRITVDSFYIPAHRTIFQAILDLHEKGSPVDLLTVGQRLRELNKLDYVGGLSFVEGLIDSTPTAAALEHYADIVAEKYRLRAIIDAARAAAEAAYKGEDDAQSIASRLDLDVAAIVEKAGDNAPLHQVAAQIIDEWESPASAHKKIRLPWSWLDVATGGGLTDELVYVAGQPSAGKTAWAVNLATSAARAGKKVAFASLESAKRHLASRFIAHVGQVNTLSLRRQAATPELWLRARAAIEQIRALDLTVTDIPMTDIELRAWARAQRARGRCDLLIIDNLKHVQPSRAYHSEPERFKAISERIKWLRDEIRVPVVVLHHLTDDGKMAWSRDILRDADIVIAISKTADNSATASRVEVKIEKNREAIAGVKKIMVFHKDVQTFAEISTTEKMEVDI